MEEHHIIIHESAEDGHHSIVYEMIEDEESSMTWGMVGSGLFNIAHVGMFVVGLMMFIPVHPFDSAFIILGFALMVVSSLGIFAFNGCIRYRDAIKISFVAFVCLCIMCISL